VTAATEAAGRIVTLDVLRGVAVMGIFSVNVVGFAMPDPAYLNPAAYGGATGADLAIWALNFVLIDNKMRCLFSVLFGASLLLVVERAEAAGRSAAGVHFRRMFWLLVFGLIHFYLIWDGDILSLYAPVGMIAFLFRKMPVERLLGAAFVFLLIDVGFMGEIWREMAEAQAAAQAPGASAAAIAAWQSAGDSVVPLTPSALSADLALHRGGWAGIVAARLAKDGTTPLVNLMALGPQTLGLMLLGMAGLRSGFLTGRWDGARYRRIAAAALALALPVHAAIAWWSWRSGFDGATLFGAYYLVSMPFYYVQAAGYAAAIVLLTRRGGRLVERLAAAGRAAFTNYLGTSLLAGAVFFGYGLGLYGRVDRLHAWLIVPLLWAIILLWSKLWLDRYRYGPFEYAWRALARWRFEPMRR
jgi:uncharacterized protein